MNAYTLTAVAVVCVTVFGGLVCVLRHLAEMRLTAGEWATFDGRLREAEALQARLFEAQRVKLEEYGNKLTAIDNRTKRG